VTPGPWERSDCQVTLVGGPRDGDIVWTPRNAELVYVPHGAGFQFSVYKPIPGRESKWFYDGEDISLSKETESHEG